MTGTTTTAGARLPMGVVPVPAGDLPAPTGPDGWAPAQLKVVRSNLTGGFPGATLHAAFGGVAERHGQKLTQAQIDAFAPFYAARFQLSEGFVRAELAKVNIYVGGPSANQNAMTIGHHIYLPDEHSLEYFTSRRGAAWMAHELSHAMQYDADHGRSAPRFLADYATGFVIGHDPQDGGRAVWGPLFTGLQVAGHREDELGASPRTIAGRAADSVVPGVVVGGIGGLITGGLLAAATATRGRAPLALRTPFASGAALFAAPAIAGAALGMAGTSLSTGNATLTGVALGAGSGAAALALGGAFAHRSPVQLVGIGAVLVGTAALGGAMARISASTTHGWSNTTAERTDDGRDVRSDSLTYGDALHDAHWYELDAEASSRDFMRGGRPDGSERGTIPSGADSPRQRVADRVDWGLKLPLVVGIPAAGIVGGGVLGARVLGEVRQSLPQVVEGKRSLMSDALRNLGIARRGVGNSLAIGGALALAPLVAGASIGQLTGGAGHETLGGSIGGGVAGAAVGTSLLTLALRGRATGTARAAWLVGGGLLAGALGTIAGSAAANAVHPRERAYLPD